MKRRLRIILFIFSLHGAGAERVLVQLANNLAKRGEDVTILTFDEVGDSFYSLEPSVEVRALGLAGASGHFLEAVSRNVKSLIALRSVLRASRPDLVISFMDTANVRVLLATIGLDTPVVVSERSDPAKRNIGKAWEVLRAPHIPPCCTGDRAEP